MTHCRRWSKSKVKSGGACSLGKFGGKPSLGACARCNDNTAKEVWPVITVRGANLPPRACPLPPLIPSPAEQTAWRFRVLPICETCPAFGGVQETPGMKITHRIKCAECKTCGSKTVGPMQDCPLEKFKAFHRGAADASDRAKP